MSIARLASSLIFLALAGYSGFIVSQDHAARFVLAVADRLDHRESVDKAEVVEAAGEVVDGGFVSNCRSDLLRPGLSVVLSNLGQLNLVRDYDAWVAASKSTQAYLASMIRCTPSDGNAWLRDTLVSRAVAEDPQRLYATAAVARALMPYEEQQIFARIYLWKRLSPLALSISENLARSDISITLRYGNSKLKAWLSEGASPAFAHLVDTERVRLAPSHPD